MISSDSIARYCVVLFALSGCVDSGPSPAGIAMQKLTAACDAGDTQACATILDQQQRQKEAWLRAQTPTGPSTAEVYSSVAMQPRASVPIQPLQSGMKVCPNGMIVQQYYIC